MLSDGRLYIKPLEPAFKTSRSRGGVKTGGCPTYIDNVFHDVPVPVHYNNMIDLGYTRVTFGENFINKREADPDFPWEIVSCAGREPAYR